MSYRFADSLRAGSGRNRTELQFRPDPAPVDGQKNSPKHVEFYSENKFEKLVNLVGFNIRSKEAHSPIFLNNFILLSVKTLLQ